MADWQWFLGSAAVLAAAVWLVYYRAVPTPFIFDDVEGIVVNPSIVRLWPLMGDDRGPGPLTPPKDLPTCGRPLANLTLAINYAIGGVEPKGYHVFNILVHLLSSIVLAALVRRTLQLPYFSGECDRVAGPLSLAVALVWALHPVQTEAVVYVTQRTELLVGLFYFSTLYASVRYWTSESSAAGALWIGVATLACLAGMASKEVMVSAPLVVLLFERTFVAGSFSQALRRSWPLYFGLALGWALLFALNYEALGGNGPRSKSTGFDHALPAYQWWFTQCKMLLMYLKLAVWPWPLVIHYGTPHIKTVDEALPWVAPVALLMGGTLLLLWRNWPTGFLTASVWLIMAPTLIVPIMTEVAAERRMYLPLAALAGLVVVGGYRAAHWFVQRNATPVDGEVPVDATTPVDASLAPCRPLQVTLLIATAAVLVYGLVSYCRLDAYQDELTLWEDARVHQPNDHLVYNSLGCIMAKKNRIRDAIGYFETAVELDPRYEVAHSNLGFMLVNAGEIDRAIKHLQIALELRPAYPEALSNLGMALLRANRPRDAIEPLEHALYLKPGFLEALVNMGAALVKTDRAAEALPYLDRALRINQDYADAWALRANAYRSLQRPVDAVAAAERALQLATTTGQTEMVNQLQAFLAAERGRLPQQTTSPGPAPSPPALPPAP